MRVHCETHAIALALSAASDHLGLIPVQDVQAGAGLLSGSTSANLDPTLDTGL
jgi:hypothetical protein